MTDARLRIQRVTNWNNIAIRPHHTNQQIVIRQKYFNEQSLYDPDEMTIINLYKMISN